MIPASCTNVDVQRIKRIMLIEFEVSPQQVVLYKCPKCDSDHSVEVYGQGCLRPDSKRAQLKAWLAGHLNALQKRQHVPYHEARAAVGGAVFGVGLDGLIGETRILAAAFNATYLLVYVSIAVVGVLLILWFIGRR